MDEIKKPSNSVQVKSYIENLRREQEEARNRKILERKKALEKEYLDKFQKENSEHRYLYDDSEYSVFDEYNDKLFIFDDLTRDYLATYAYFYSRHINGEFFYPDEDDDELPYEYDEDD